MASKKSVSFTASVYKVGVNPTISIPEDVARKLGISGFTKIKGKINNVEFETTLIPVDHKPHILYVKPDLRQKIGIDFGDVANLTIQLA